MFSSISGHASLLKRISIGLIAGGLIFKGLRNYLPIITRYSALASGRKPLKIRPLPDILEFLLRYPLEKTAMIFD